MKTYKEEIQVKFFEEFCDVNNDRRARAFVTENWPGKTTETYRPPAGYINDFDFGPEPWGTDIC